MIVCKFGGTSVGDPAAIGRVVAIVRTRVPERPLVVVSALAGVTDALLGLAAPIAAGDRAAAAAGLEAVVRRHEETARTLELPPHVAAEIRDEAWQAGGWLAAAAGRALEPAELDALAGRGELWSSRLVAAALERAGLPGAWVDVREVMVTDGGFSRARPDREALALRGPRVFGPLLQAGRIPVTQGFIGATLDGHPTTLGRGGSDFTAALLGAALQAGRVEIWTDVDGLMTADPRIVPDARLLPVASHHEAAELATFGAKVLHPATQAPLVEAGIPCVVLNSFSPERPGTTIVAGAKPQPVGDSPVRAISIKRNVTVLNLRAPRMLGEVGFLRALFEVFERHEVAVDVVSTSEVNVSLTIDDPACLEALCRDLGQLGQVRVFEQRAIVAVVGIGLRGTKGLAARIFSAIRSINVEVISQGASEINVTLVVEDQHGPEAVRLLHREFFGEAAGAAA